MVRFLLANGADASMNSTEGLTPLQAAIKVEVFSLEFNPRHGGDGGASATLSHFPAKIRTLADTMGADLRKRTDEELDAAIAALEAHLGPTAAQTQLGSLRAAPAPASSAVKVDGLLAASCANCGFTPATFKCSRCLSVKYCGKKCQAAAWKQHKRLCETQSHYQSQGDLSSKESKAIVKDETLPLWARLITACSIRRVAAVRELLKEIPDINISQDRSLPAAYDTIQQISPLTSAVFAGHIDVARLLLDAGANPDVASAGFTPLHLAAKYNHVEIVRLLIRHAADLNVGLKPKLSPTMAMKCFEDVTGNTPLICAVYGRFLEVISLLIEAGAAIDAVNSEGKTALMISMEFAAGREKPAFTRVTEAPVVAYLLDKGADVHFVNKKTGASARSMSPTAQRWPSCCSPRAANRTTRRTRESFRCTSRPRRATAR